MIGIDKFISDQNKRFEQKLYVNIATTKKRFYGQVEKQTKGNQVKALIYNAALNDYDDVRYDDTLSFLCFYDTGDKDAFGLTGQCTQEVAIICMVNLSDLYPTESIRSQAKEKAYSDVCKQIEIAGLFDIKKIVKDGDVYGDIDSASLKQYDFHPFHVFRINCTSKPFSINCNYKNY